MNTVPHLCSLNKTRTHTQELCSAHTHTQLREGVESQVELHSQHSWLSKVNKELGVFICPCVLFAF